MQATPEDQKVPGVKPDQILIWPFQTHNVHYLCPKEWIVPNGVKVMLYNVTVKLYGPINKETYITLRADNSSEEICVTVTSDNPCGFSPKELICSSGAVVHLNPICYGWDDRDIVSVCLRFFKCTITLIKFYLL